MDRLEASRERGKKGTGYPGVYVNCIVNEGHHPRKVGIAPFSMPRASISKSFTKRKNALVKSPWKSCAA